MDDDRVNPPLSVVEALVTEQFPQWAGWPITQVLPGGWDNRTYRLGKGLGLRLPSAARYQDQITKEAEWLPKLAGHLPYLIPEPVAVGRPGFGCAFPWMVFEWQDGETLSASDAALRSEIGLAHALGAALTALWAMPLPGGPLAGAQNFHRGGDLSVYDGETRRLIADLPEPQCSRATTLWDRALDTPQAETRHWIHGDVSDGNILLRAGQFAGLLDFGLCGVGDLSSDLVPYWTIFEGAARDAFRRSVAQPEACWDRAAGWALWKALLVARVAPDDPMAKRCLVALDLPRPLNKGKIN